MVGGSHALGGLPSKQAPSLNAPVYWTPSRVACRRVTNLASIFESGAVYYPMILLLPVAAGVALAKWRPVHALWILLAVVFAFVVLDFALDDTRMDDIAFFVVLGAFMFGLGMLARAVARRVLRPSQTT